MPQGSREGAARRTAHSYDRVHEAADAVTLAGLGLRRKERTRLRWARIGCATLVTAVCVRGIGVLGRERR